MQILEPPDSIEDYRYVVTKKVVRGVQGLLQARSSASQDLVQSLQSTIIGFKDLETNWDSYGAKPLSPLAINNALLALKILSMKFLRPFRVSPSRDGNILFECAVNNGRLLVEVGSDNEVGVVWEKKDKVHLEDPQLSYLHETLSKLDERL